MRVKFSDIKVGKSFIFNDDTYVKTKEAVINISDDHVNLINCVNTSDGEFDFMFGIQEVRIGDE